METTTCLKCNISFNHYGKNRKYCSRKCYGANNTGDKNVSKNSEVRAKISLSKIGNKNWMFNRKMELCPTWKGENAGYQAKHSWIKRMFGSPETCEECKKTGLCGKKIQWANISQEYKRIRSDWRRLCTSCHRIFDKHNLKVKKDPVTGRFIKKK